MTDITVDRVIVSLEARLADYQRKLDGATHLFERNMTRIERSAVGVETITRRAFGGVAAVVSTLGLMAAGRDAVETAIKFKRFEQALATATGSAGKAGEEMAFLRDLADRLGVRLQSLAQDYVGLTAATRGTALQGEATREIFETVTKAVIAAGGSPEQLSRALVALQQIVSKGNVSAEELRGQLGEALPGAFQIAARAMGVTTGQLNKMLEQGDLLSTTFLPKFIAQLREELPGAIEAADAPFARFQTALDDAKRTVADEFITDLTDATNDFAGALRQMQADGTLKALGQGLADIVRLAAGTAKVIGGIVGKIQELDEARARFADRQAMRSPLASREEKAAASRREAGRLRQDALHIREREQTRDEALLKVLGRDTEAARRIRERMVERQKKIDAAKPKPAPTPTPTSTPTPTPTDTGGGETDAERKKRLREEAAQRRREAAGALAEAREAVGVKADLARAEAELLSAKQDLATSAADRARFELDLIEADRRARAEELVAESSARDLELESRRLAKQLTDDQVASLKAENAANTAKLSALNDQVAAARVAAVRQAEADRIAAEAVQVRAAGLEAEADLLQRHGALADTADERRAIELRLVDLAYERERIELEAIRDSRLASDAEKEIARARLRMLDQLRTADIERVRRDTAGPLERYRDDVTRTPEEMNEALQSIAADGIRAVNDGLVDAAVNFRNLGDIGREVLRDLTAQMLQLQLDKYVSEPLTAFAQKAIGPAPTLDVGAVNAGVDAALASVPSGIPTTPGATSPDAQAVSGLGEAATTAAQAITGNTIPALAQQVVSTITGATAETAATTAVTQLATAALFAAAALEAVAASQAMSAVGSAAGGAGGFAALGGGFATGGHISGPGTGTSDSIPIMASNGEFMVNAKATKKHRALLEAINAGRDPHRGARGYFLGGMVKKFGRGALLGGLGARKLSPASVLMGKAGLKDITPASLLGGVAAKALRPHSRAEGRESAVAPVQFGDVHMNFPGVTNRHEARMTMKQANSALMDRIGTARRQGQR